MSLEEIQSEIEKKLAERRSKILNRNAMAAFFGAFSDPVAALGKVFIGRQDALDAEKQRLIQEQLLSLLCRIDEVITQSKIESTVVDGLIEASGANVDDVVGVHVEPSGGPVFFQPGTHLRASGENAKRVTGLVIGRRSGDCDDA